MYIYEFTAERNLNASIIRHMYIYAAYLRGIISLDDEL
jgi:hypothetical protein